MLNYWEREREREREREINFVEKWDSSLMSTYMDFWGIKFMHYFKFVSESNLKQTSLCIENGRLLILNLIWVLLTAQF